VQYLADGTVTSATISQSSHNRDLDRAALVYARQIRLCPGAPGNGLLPLDMKL
jgi:protein TonB